jgi:hypothetical protein
MGITITTAMTSASSVGGVEQNIIMYYYAQHTEAVCREWGELCKKKKPKQKRIVYETIANKESTVI